MTHHKPLQLDDLSKNLVLLCVKLQNMNDGLVRMEKATEGEFLGIGSKLQVLRNKSEKMAKAASSAVNTISGEEIALAMKEIKNLLHGGNSYLNQADIEFAQTDNMLKYIMHILTQISSDLASFEKHVKHLKVFSINVKILGAQLTTGREEFENLANDISDLVRNIEKKSRAITSSCRSLSNSIKDALYRVDKHEKKYRRLTDDFLGETESALYALNERYNSASNTAAELSDLSNRIYSNIQNVLVSLQFHDITRQQVDQVVTSIKKSCSMIDSVLVIKPDLAAYQAAIASTRETCDIQAAQLSKSKEDLRAAIEGLIRNFDEIMRSANEMGAKTLRMAGTSSGNGSSFLKEMEQYMDMVTSSLQESITECEQIGNALSSMVRDVAKTAGSMTSYINEIDEIGTQVEVLSLNARIKSAHTGKEGLGLTVVAEEIQAVAENICIWTEKISNTLKSMVTAIQEDLGFGLDSLVDQRNAETRKMITDLGLLRKTFNENNNKISSLLIEVSKDGKELAPDIEHAFVDVAVHKRALAALEKAVTELNEVVALSSVFDPQDMPGENEITHKDSGYASFEENDKVRNKKDLLQPKDGYVQQPVKKEDQIEDNVVFF